MGNSLTISKGGPNPIDVIELQVQQNLNRDTAVIRKGSDFAVLFESKTQMILIVKQVIYIFT